jgi:hypothetical protein
MKGDSELAALVAAIDADDECQIALGEVIGRFRRRREREIMDRQAALLLPLGWRVVVERLGGCKATAYNRAERGRTKSKQTANG